MLRTNTRPIFLVLLFSCFLIQSGFSQSSKVGKIKSCDHCKMDINDPLFMAKASSEEAELHFDAIECLVNFLRENEGKDFESLWVADYTKSGKMIKAESATFLKSKNIPSPMGAYISAYGTRDIANKIKKEFGGELYNWEELKVLFKDSRFGLLDHPTHHHHTPGSYAPIGVMGDHLHHKGGFMLSLRYMDMQMDGNLEGSNDISDDRVFQDYMVSPQSMGMRMLMLGAMYAPSDKVTLMLMQGIIENQMQLTSRMGMEFKTQSQGLGDMKASALIGMMAKNNMSFHLNTGLNIPIGDIQQRDATPMNEDMKLPYPMQLGSGTFDLTIGGTYKYSTGKVNLGFQPLGTIRTGSNSEGYRFGDQLSMHGWASYDLSNWLSFSGRVSGNVQGKIHGKDSELMPMMAPPANYMNSGGTRVMSFVGSNFSLGSKPGFRNFKFGLEYGIPLYQNVNGIQMSVNSSFIVGLRVSL